jgi:hypothetical protein
MPINAHPEYDHGYYANPQSESQAFASDNTAPGCEMTNSTYLNPVFVQHRFG